MGKREFDNAVSATGLEKELNITYHAYELQPDSLKEPTMTMLEGYAKKSNMPVESLKQNFTSITDRASSLGLEFNLDHMMAQDTRKAHRVAKYAAEQGKGRAFQEKAFHAIFTDNLFLPHTDVLVELACELGLDKEKAREIAEDKNAYMEDLKKDKELANQHGIKSVPYFLIDGKPVNGSQPQAIFEDVLKKAVQVSN